VHTSTWNVYGLEQGEIRETSAQLGATSWINYNRSKFLGEEEVRRGIARGLDAIRRTSSAATTGAAGRA
jgi:dihydroflavonol-4-reductase